MGRHSSHAFVGFWGRGCPEELTDELLCLISKTGLQGWRLRCSVDDSIYSAKERARSILWQVASIGTAEQALNSYSLTVDEEQGDRLLAGLSASWINSFAHPNGTVHPDAWVKTRHLSVDQIDQLILGREPFGHQPLYWKLEGDRLWFASQQSLLLPLLASPTIDLQALHAYSCFSYVPTPLSPVQGIASVSAGTEVVWEVGRQRLGLHQASARTLMCWKEGDHQITTETEACELIQRNLHQAIRRQLANRRLDEPVGVFLSGGLDSSVVAALLVQSGVDVRAYTIDLDDHRISEANYAQNVADWLSIPLVRVRVTPRLLRQVLTTTVRSLDLPYGDGVTLPFVLLAQQAKEETSFIFNGEGGDQLFAGWTNKPLIAASVYDAYQGRSESFLEQYMRTFHRFWGLEELIFQSETRQAFSPQSMLVHLSEALDPTMTTHLLHRLRRASLMLKGAQNIQPRATAIAQSHGLALCSPFCDLALTELSFSISPDLHLQKSCEKYILKRAVEHLLPPDIVWRQKRGMGLPLTRWCSQNFWYDIKQWLHPALLSQQGHWDPHLPERLFAGNVSGTLHGRRIGECLWLMVMWQQWRSLFLPGDLDAPGPLDRFQIPAWLWTQLQQASRRT